MRFVIAGGGTAGHINPALAVADALGSDEVTFIGTQRGAESAIVPARGYALDVIGVRGFDRSRPLSLFPVGVRAVGAVGEARRILKKRSPRALLGMGGFVSLPACVAARTLRIPIVLHEQNAVLGLANRLCKPFASAVAVSFETTLQAAGPHAVVVGNPVDAELVSADWAAERARSLERWGLDAARKTLLVFGGSQGAQRINEAAAGLAALWSDREDVQILHITGRSGAPHRPAMVPEGARLIYRVVDFVDRMIDAYSVADLALCRGGATTVAELTVRGLPAIVVPYPHHRDRQQELHGRALQDAGAAVMVADEAATASRVAETADEILRDAPRLAAMAEAAGRLGRPDAAIRLAEVLRTEAAP